MQILRFAVPWEARKRQQNHGINIAAFKKRARSELTRTSWIHNSVEAGTPTPTQHQEERHGGCGEILVTHRGDWKGNTNKNGNSAQN